MSSRGLTKKELEDLRKKEEEEAAAHVSLLSSTTYSWYRFLALNHDIVHNITWFILNQQLVLLLFPNQLNTSCSCQNAFKLVKNTKLLNYLQVFKEFVETFQEAPTSAKVWVKAGTYDAGARSKNAFKYPVLDYYQ